MAKGRMTTRRAKAAPARRATVRKPYGDSRYGNDAFIKVEAVEPIGTGIGNNSQVFSTMRVNEPQGVSPGNTYLRSQLEY